MAVTLFPRIRAGGTLGPVARGDVP
jgi:hypothetical protein